MVSSLRLPSEASLTGTVGITLSNCRDVEIKSLKHKAVFFSLIHSPLNARNKVNTVPQLKLY